MEKRSRRRTRDLVVLVASQGLSENGGADIHYGQDHKRSMQGPDTEAQDHPPFAEVRLATHGRQMPRPDIAMKCD